MATHIEISDQKAAAGGCAADSYLLPLLSTKPNAFMPFAPSRLSRLLKLLRLLFFISVAISSVAMDAYLLTRDLNYTRIHRFQLASVVVFPLNFNRSAGKLNAAWDFTLRVDNPNPDRKIYYDDIQASVLYLFETAGFSDEIQYLAVKSAPSFVRKEKKRTWLRFRVRALEKALNGAAADQLFSKMYRGSMRFELRFAARRRYKIGDAETKEETLRVACNTMNVDFDVERTGLRTVGSSCEVF